MIPMPGQIVRDVRDRVLNAVLDRVNGRWHRALDCSMIGDSAYAVLHNWSVVREFGVRYWVAWRLVRLAYLVKDTTLYAVVCVEHRDGSHSSLLISGDTWGNGVIAGRRHGSEWPLVVEDLTDVDEAMDIMDDPSSWQSYRDNTTDNNHARSKSEWDDKESAKYALGDLKKNKR